MNQIPHGYVAVSVAADTLGITVRQVDRLIEAGKLEAIKVGWRKYISRESVAKYRHIQRMRKVQR
ncbi:hypothetical protein NITHO_2030005 [Nitrolancea hollandica Lb]|uniref:Helix-turn-helix domain-containing protein n=1 Tax=Nitrolancea hollandica Lb TaxID=1129897 RepID=I4EEV1_9BACT|nr:hypothetical protein NITHO_2030005 [Nitrolancea hollandica Lb]